MRLQISIPSSESIPEATRQSLTRELKSLGFTTVGINSKSNRIALDLQGPDLQFEGQAAEKGAGAGRG